MYQYSANFSPQTFSETHFCAEFEKVCDQADIFFCSSWETDQSILEFCADTQPDV